MYLRTIATIKSQELGGVIMEIALLLILLSVFLLLIFHVVKLATISALHLFKDQIVKEFEEGERFGETKYSIVDVVDTIRNKTHENNNKE